MYQELELYIKESKKSERQCVLSQKKVKRLVVVPVDSLLV